MLAQAKVTSPIPGTGNAAHLENAVAPGTTLSPAWSRP
jgi:hypothetical protein